ncbi:MAG: hypothetical protein AB7Q42_20890 [Acidimicrobiia bacterium]
MDDVGERLDRIEEKLATVLQLLGLALAERVTRPDVPDFIGGHGGAGGAAGDGGAAGGGGGAAGGGGGSGGVVYYSVTAAAPAALLDWLDTEDGAMAGDLRGDLLSEDEGVRRSAWERLRGWIVEQSVDLPAAVGASVIGAWLGG